MTGGAPGAPAGWRAAAGLLATPTLLAALLLSSPPPASAAIAGDLDQTFSGDGLVALDFGDRRDEHALGIALQADGKIVIAGEWGLGTSTAFAVARLNPDGSPDPSFAGDGTTMVEFGPGGAAAHVVAVQPDGKIVVAGWVDDGGGAEPDFALARLEPDGDPDPTFSGDGKLVTDFNGGYDTANAVAVQPDGRVVAAGSGVGLTGTPNFALARYNADGSLDTGFNGDGIVTTDFDDGADTVWAVAVQPDGRIVAAGGAGPAIGSGETSFDFGLARYLPNGELDDSFSENGWLLTDFGGSEVARGLALQSDGRFVVAGWVNPAGSLRGRDFALARYDAAGSLDRSFAGDGTRVTDFAGTDDAANAVAVQADGKVVAAGVTVSPQPGAATEFALARYRADGALDPAFGAGGLRTTDFGAAEEAFALAIQADGKPVLAGDVRSPGGDYDFAVARYLGESPPGPPAQADTTVTVAIKGRRVKLRRSRRLVVRLACPASEQSPPCAGRLRVRTRNRVGRRGKRWRVGLAGRRFALDAGARRRLQLRLSRRKARLVRTRRRARSVTAIATVGDAAGNEARVVKRLRLRVSRRR